MLKYHDQLRVSISEREEMLFDEYVYEIYGFEPPTDRYRDVEIVNALLAWMDQDHGAEVELRLDALDQRLADTSGGYSRRRTGSADPLLAEDVGCGNGNHVRPLVSSGVYADFKEYVDELDVDMSYAEAVRWAMREHRHGGREQRMADRLEDMMDAVGSAAVDTQEPETETAAESESKPYSVEDKIEAILGDVAALGRKETAHAVEQLPKARLTEFIHNRCAKGDRSEASDKTVGKYLEAVTDELDLIEDPKNGVLLIKAGTVDGLPFELRPFDALSTDQRIAAIRVKLARKASSSAGTQGRAQFTAADIQNELFETEVGESVAHDLRAKTAEADGFRERDPVGREKAAAVDLADITDETILEAEDVDESYARKKEVATEMDDFVEGEPVTAGGSDSIGGNWESMENGVISPQR